MAAFVVSLLVQAQNLPLPPLPYDYNALEPHIDEATMRLHHLSHHKTYTDKLNGALEALRKESSLKHLAKMGIDALLQNLREFDKIQARALFLRRDAATDTLERRGFSHTR